MLALKVKITISVVSTVLVITVAVILLWWYQGVLFGDALVRYIPSETVVYTHINTNHPKNDFLDFYFLTLDRFLGFQNGSFKIRVLPYITEGAFFIFVDPVTKKDVSALILKTKKDQDSQSKIQEVASTEDFYTKNLKRNVIVIAKSKNVLDQIQWSHNRAIGLRLNKIANNHYFTFFLHRNWIVKRFERSNTLPKGIATLFDSYMSRWQPFLYGAIGTYEQKTIFSLSDFAEIASRAHSFVKLVNLGDFSAYYEAENLHNILSEFDIKIPEFVTAGYNAGVLIKKQVSKKPLFVFSLKLKAKDDTELKAVLFDLMSNFIPVKRVFELPDGTQAYEIISNSKAFSFRYIENQAGTIVWQIMVDEKPIEMYVEKISLEDGIVQIYIAKSLESIALAKQSLANKDQNFIPEYCMIDGAAEFFQFTNQALPDIIRPLIPTGQYLLARIDTKGFELRGCEL